MLHAPTTDHQMGGWPNKIYPLAKVRQILTLASQNIQGLTPNLFVATANEDALQLLTYAISTFDSDRLDGALQQAFQTHLARLYSQCSQTDSMQASSSVEGCGNPKIGAPSSATGQLMSLSADRPVQRSTSLTICETPIPRLMMDFERLHVTNPDAAESQSPPVSVKMPTEIEWAVLVKLALKDGQLLHRDSIAAISAWHELKIEMASLYKYYKENIEGRIDLSHFKMKKAVAVQLLTNFIGDLVRLGQTESAEVIHLFLSLLKHAYAHKDSNGLDENKVGLVLASALGEGLNLLGYLHTDEPMAQKHDAAPIEAQVNRSEQTFLKFCFKYLLNSDVFIGTFNAAFYQKHGSHHFAETYANLLELVTNGVHISRISPRGKDAIELVPLDEGCEHELSHGQASSNVQHARSDELPKTPKRSMSSLNLRRFFGGGSKHKAAGSSPRDASAPSPSSTSGHALPRRQTSASSMPVAALSPRKAVLVRRHQSHRDIGTASQPGALYVMTPVADEDILSQQRVYTPAQRFGLSPRASMPIGNAGQYRPSGLPAETEPEAASGQQRDKGKQPARNKCK